ncbi:VCBS repeat-containing protein [Flagellimonas allohymeniacidonis]|uniref:VCBS repeat-containing protein n=1 Tax=Flagellimonas allohymeniacidonis TaxID=2517819 RepID=UPI0028BE1A6A|nr:VCBS repeat-containing protein [Allomuricauda hymeniacidonis]
MILLLVSCTKQPKLFTEVDASKSGVNFVNELTDTPELNILSYLYYYNGGGVAAADFNNDGWIDLFFTGNQVQDELYLNKGNLTFEKITKESGIETSGSWSTGVSHVDINNDGLLDIYICKASNHKNLKGQNLLYVNQGVNKDGTPLFEEMAAEYGLDFAGLSTKAAFFDYDLDGDLDMYLMNHSEHPNRTYGKGAQRKGFDALAGDVLFQNQDGYFEEVSKEAGIFQGKSGYGLGLSIGDVNNDGYPDIYLGNDFFENDYLYLNQKDGTFKEIISDNNAHLGHTTHYSMGNEIADLNNDGLLDIISLDMLPEDLETYKTSGQEYGYPIYQQYLRNGYAPQYMRNTLHLNLGGSNFSEIGFLSGIAATEWSWGALAADFDNDGYKDLFISNGIKGATNDMDYMNFIANDDIQKRIGSGMNENDLPIVDEIPEKKVPNYFFKNNGDLTFQNVSENWYGKQATYSHGCIYADLDNDGDLDVVVNNHEQVASILENTSQTGSYLKISFEGPEHNRFGIGARVVAYMGQEQVVNENYPNRSYLSSVPAYIHMGLGNVATLDSLKVVWPGGKSEVLEAIPTNSSIKVSFKKATSSTENKTQPENTLLEANDSLVKFIHKEQASLDFDREPLIPFADSNNGPSIAIGDVNNDGKQDVFFGGAKGQQNALFIQGENGGFEADTTFLDQNSINEATASIFFDANGDGQEDLLIAYGGNEFKSGKPLQPTLHLNQQGTLIEQVDTFKGVEINASDIAVGDIDADGDLDIFLVSDRVPASFGKTPRQFLLVNDGTGKFEDQTQKLIPQLEYLGNIKDVEIVDINQDGLPDIVVVGHWMPVSVFINQKDGFTLQEGNGLENTEGLWNSLTLGDFDNDGDLDFICGNWGLNSKFKASNNEPVSLYRNDFDKNGSVEPLVTYYHQGIETPFASKDDLTKQMPFLNKEYLSYKKFAQASLTDLFGKNSLSESEKKYVYTLQSAYFENNGQGNFTSRPLPQIAQASQINDIAINDFNNDGYLDLLIVGNNHHISTQLGRLDAFHGLILRNDTKGNFFWDQNQHLQLNGVVKTIREIKINDKTSFVVGRNDQATVVLQKK